MRSVVLAVLVLSLLVAVLAVGCEKPPSAAAGSSAAAPAPAATPSPAPAPIASPVPASPPVASPAPSRPAVSPFPASSGDPTVYVTNTGKKYHSAGCRYLAKSQRALTLSQAKAQGYTPCSRCGPPQ